jgi:hypothetical protein
VAEVTVTFDALMKKLEVKSLVSGDKGGRLLLEFRVDPEHDELVSSLNRLMRADAEVQVTVSC